MRDDLFANESKLICKWILVCKWTKTHLQMNQYSFANESGLICKWVHDSIVLICKWAHSSFANKYSFANELRLICKWGPFANDLWLIWFSFTNESNFGTHLQMRSICIWRVSYMHTPQISLPTQTPHTISLLPAWLHCPLLWFFQRTRQPTTHRHIQCWQNNIILLPGRHLFHHHLKYEKGKWSYTFDCHHPFLPHHTILCSSHHKSTTINSTTGVRTRHTTTTTHIKQKPNTNPRQKPGLQQMPHGQQSKHQSHTNQEILLHRQSYWRHHNSRHIPHRIWQQETPSSYSQHLLCHPLEI